MAVTGTLLQKLRNYRIQRAVVWTPTARPLSRRFGNRLAEENRGRSLRLFEERDLAEVWLLED